MSYFNGPSRFHDRMPTQSQRASPMKLMGVLPRGKLTRRSPMKLMLLTQASNQNQLSLPLKKPRKLTLRRLNLMILPRVMILLRAVPQRQLVPWLEPLQQLSCSKLSDCCVVLHRQVSFKELGDTVLWLLVFLTIVKIRFDNDAWIKFALKTSLLVARCSSSSSLCLHLINAIGWSALPCVFRILSILA